MSPVQPDLFDQPLLEGLAQAREVISASEERALITSIDGVELSPFRFQGWLGKRLTSARDNTGHGGGVAGNGARAARVLGPLAASRLANMYASGNEPCSNSPTAALIISARATTATSTAGKSPSSLHATTRGFFKVCDRRCPRLSRAVASLGNAWAYSMVPTTKLARPFRLPPKWWELDHGFSNFAANNKTLRH